MKLGYKCWLQGEEKIFGKGPYDLLCAIKTYGSIKKASTELDISYSKATHILKRCESHMGFKLLNSKIGGNEGGGSNLTDEAMYLMKQYEAFINEADIALKHAFAVNFGQFFDEIHGLNEIDNNLPRILLLTGESGIGKSTLLRKLTKPYIKDFSGFEVQRYLPDNGGDPLGFEITPLHYYGKTTTMLNRDEWRDLLTKNKALFLKRDEDGKMIRYLEVLEKWIPKLAKTDRPLILDEIGGMELTSELISNHLKKLLTSDAPIIGVLKSKERLNRLNLRTDGPKLSLMEQDEYLEDLESEIKILEITPSNKDFVKRYINKWLYKMMEENYEKI